MVSQLLMQPFPKLWYSICDGWNILSVGICCSSTYCYSQLFPGPLRGSHFCVPLTSHWPLDLCCSVRVMQKWVLRWKLKALALMWLFSSLVTRGINLEEICSFSLMPELRHGTELKLTSVVIYHEWEESLLYYSQLGILWYLLLHHNFAKADPDYWNLCNISDMTLVCRMTRLTQLVNFTDICVHQVSFFFVWEYYLLKQADRRISVWKHF